MSQFKIYWNLKTILIDRSTGKVTSHDHDFFYISPEDAKKSHTLYSLEKKSLTFYKYINALNTIVLNKSFIK